MWKYHIYQRGINRTDEGVKKGMEFAGNKEMSAEENVQKNKISLNSDSTVITRELQKPVFRINNDNTVKVTDELKKDYHKQRLAQSKWAFRLSFCGSILGFLVLLWSVYQSVRTGNMQWIGVVSGTVTEGVSALFYNMSNKANEKISEFFIELTKDSKIKDAIRLSNEVEDAKVKDELKMRLSLYLAGIAEDKK